jgi:hypothetical protein
MHDALKLSALQSACSLCDQAVPEKEGSVGLYQGMLALLNILEEEIWGAAYIMWEIALLRELGFSLDLSTCAGGGDKNMLAYVSPKTGRAVSYQAGEPYKDKLLPLPSFLKPNGGSFDPDDVQTGLQLTQFFLEHWVFAHHRSGLPEARARLGLRFAEVFANCISERAASIIRAPPLFEIIIKGILFFSEYSAARAIFSPTTLPIEPPINPKSIQAITKSLPIDLPTAVRTASFSLVFSIASLRRCVYFFVSSNFKGSFEVIPLSSSLNLLSSNNISKYSLLPMRT